MRNLSKDEIKRFLIFSRAFEYIENKNIESPVVNAYYEKRFRSFDSFYKDLPERSYYRMAQKHIAADYRRVNRSRYSDKSCKLDNFPEAETNQEEKIVFNNLILKLKEVLTPKELEVAELLEDSRTGVEICEKLSISRPRLSIMMASIRNKLKIILKSPLTF